MYDAWVGHDCWLGAPINTSLQRISGAWVKGPSCFRQGKLCNSKRENNLLLPLARSDNDQQTPRHTRSKVSISLASSGLRQQKPNTQNAKQLGSQRPRTSLASLYSIWQIIMGDLDGAVGARPKASGTIPRSVVLSSPLPSLPPMSEQAPNPGGDQAFLVAVMQGRDTAGRVPCRAVLCASVSVNQPLDRLV